MERRASPHLVSPLPLDMRLRAHVRAAAKGNIKVVRWLLYNGASESIHTKNMMGHTPLDLARIFGPHPEVINTPHLFYDSMFLLVTKTYDRSKGSLARSYSTEIGERN